MTKKAVSFVCFALVLGGASCVSEQDEAQRAADIITTRTVGLAYLEENRLEEAEAEFLKLIELAEDEALGYANLGLVYLRMNRYEDAELRLREALALQSDDPNIHLLLAEVFKVTDRAETAIEQLEISLQQAPDHVKTLYSLATVHGDLGSDQGRADAESYLSILVGAVPANIAARLQLAEILVRNGKADSALIHLEQTQQQVPDIPTEAIAYFNDAVDLLRLGRVEEALPSTVIVHNFLKVTPRYQQGLLELQGPGGASVGFPIITFTQNVTPTAQDPEAVLAALRFTDATVASGLDVVVAASGDLAVDADDGARVAVGDYDGDGDQDMFVSSSVPGSSQATNYLFRNEFGRFEDVLSDAGVRRDAGGAGARFADYDNDGLLDLLILGPDGIALFRNEGEGELRDVNREAGLSDAVNSLSALFVDLDHDGDLDLLLGNATRNSLFRNNLDGTFTERAAAMGLVGGATASSDLAMADFDEDGDVDLIVVNDDEPSALYTNLRQGRFEDVAQARGLEGSPGFSVVAVGDFDNDGFSDLFLAGGSEPTHALYRNVGDGSFEPSRLPAGAERVLAAIDGADADFLDFDNDGHLDLVLVGEPREAGGRGVVLLRNDGGAGFEDHSDLMPSDLTVARSVALVDYNEDGDIDLLVGEASGSVRLLRNDGGNANRYLKIQLVGLAAGSGKNNHFGVGAKLEVRAGDLYQTKTVISPMNHFGLGARLKADVVRIVWTNGVPQNLFFPGSDQDLVEQQILKGSCGFLYAWNGEEYEFVKDMVWRSALGMPMGIMAGRETYAPSEPSREYLRIPGDALVARDGLYSVQITEELWETLYLDEVRLIAVDHPDSIEVFVDEKFVPTSAPEQPLEVHQVARMRMPIAATDERGTNLLPALRDKDDAYVSNLRPARYQGVTEMHDLIVDLGGELDVAETVLLFLDGWIFPTDASINVAVSQSQVIEVVPPFVQVRDASGRWVTVIENMSFPMGKDKTVVLDLTGKFLTDDHRVRIRTNMQIYWDRAFFTTDPPDSPMQLSALQPISADLHYRGFSRLYRKGGRYGPHWFDYGDVSTDSKWIDLEGYYTRYGDVSELLWDADSKYVILNAGDEVSVTFDATLPPQLPRGWTRDFLIYSTGWLKDGDLNTATGQTVEPLPFHGMSQYPYGPEESYPSDTDHLQYLRQFNTRKVTARK
jgi:Tfp pilus assembly protein PilF